MKGLAKKTSIMLLFIILIFMILNVLLVNEYNSENKILKLVLYAITYISILLEIFIVNNFKILSGPILGALFFTLSIGAGPIAYYLFLGRTCEQEYIIILVSIFSFLIGNLVYKLLPKKNKDNFTTQIKKKKIKNYKSIEIVLWLMLIVAIMASLYYLYINKSLFFSGSYDNGRISAMSGNGIIIQAIGLGVIALCVMFELFLENKITKKRFIIFLLLAIPTALIKGFRGEIIAPIMIMMIMYNKKHKIQLKKVITLLIIGVAVIFSLGIVRQILSNGTMNWYKSFLLIFANGSINVNAILNTFPQKVNYQKGYTYLINIIMLRPGEDIDFTLWLKEQVGYSFSGGGMTPTIIGEIYINFGKTIIPIFLFMLGMIVTWFDKKYENSLELYYSSYCLYIISGVVGSGIALSEVSFLITSLVYICIKIISRLKIPD